MARQIVLTRDGKESVFDFKKVDRAKLYGKRRRVVLDEDGESCVKAELSEDGGTIIRAGMTMQAYFDADGEWVESKRLVGLNADGEPVDKVPSTLGVAQELIEAKPQDLSQNQMVSVYHVTESQVDDGLLADLAAGKLFTFPFNYRADYSAEVAFILSNAQGVFVLVTKPTTLDWCRHETVAVESFSDESDLDDDLDFEMF